MISVATPRATPPTLIQVGDDEILLSDSTRMADKMREAGVDVEIEVFPEMWHVFQLFAGKMPEGTAAIQAFTLYVDFSGSDKTQGVFFDDLSLCAVDRLDDETKTCREAK